MSRAPLVVLDIVGLTPSLIGEHTPHLKGLADEGFMAPVSPILPAVTCSAQSTLLTGKLPSEHGIVGNAATLGYENDLCCQVPNGYDNDWFQGIRIEYAGDATLSFDYVVDSEPGFDFLHVEDDSSCAVGVGDDAVADAESGATQSFSRNRDLMLGADLGRPTPPFLYFRHKCKGSQTQSRWQARTQPRSRAASRPEREGGLNAELALPGGPGGQGSSEYGYSLLHTDQASPSAQDGRPGFFDGRIDDLDLDRIGRVP